MAGDMLNIGLTGLAAFQRSLNTIGHNISNVNTPGFSRQRTILTNNDATPFGNGFVGNGSRIVTTERIYNEHAVNQVRTRTSSTEYFSVFNEFAAQIDNLLADQDAGLAPALEEFFDSVQGLADDPTSIPAREVMMTQSQALVDRIHTMDDWLSDLRKATNDRMLNQVTSINALAKDIAEMNQEIIVATGIGQGQPPNDLLDQRDTLINELSEHIGITVLTQDDGSQNIFMSGGQSLVLGTQARELVAQPNPDDPLYYEIAYKNKYLSKLVPITDTLNGGDLGGVINFKNDILVPSQNYLGWIAQGIARSFNDQHAKGIDLNDTLGTDYFTESAMNPELMMNASVYNTGASVLRNNTARELANQDIYIVADSKPASYRVDYDGAIYTIQNLSDGTRNALTVTVAGPPVEFAPYDGMYLEFDAVPNAGDSFYINTARDSARKLDLQFSDPNLIAASQPLRTWIDSGNDGRGANKGGATFDLTITDESVLGSGATVPFPLPILFDDQALPTGGTATHYSTDGGASWNAYNPAGTTLGNAITDGFTVTLSGNAIDGDHFYIDASGGKSGNQGEVQISEATITDIVAFQAAYPEEPTNILFRNSVAANVHGVADEYSPDGGFSWLPYNSLGTTITSANGWEVTLSGEAWVGDTAYVDTNTAGSGDNRNARELAELQLTGLFIGGQATIHEAYSEIVTSVGNNTQQAEINYRAQEALLNQSIELRESISGVNLDEEAANLLKFQQAYSAAAQVIAAADSIFQTLISAVRR